MLGYNPYKYGYVLYLSIYIYIYIVYISIIYPLLTGKALPSRNFGEKMRSSGPNSAAACVNRNTVLSCTTRKRNICQDFRNQKIDIMENPRRNLCFKPPSVEVSDGFRYIFQ